MEYDNHKRLDSIYYENEAKLNNLKDFKEQIKRLKKINEELKFNIQRQNDMLPLIAVYKERVRNNEKIISNLKESIEEIAKKNPKGGNLEAKISNLYLERKKLEEKKLQVNLNLKKVKFVY